MDVRDLMDNPPSARASPAASALVQLASSAPVRISTPPSISSSASVPQVPSTVSKEPSPIQPPKSSKKLKIQGNAEGNSSGEEGKKKRNRAALSCIQCKTRKVKCDRNSVAGCSNCVRRGEECQWSAGRRASGSESHHKIKGHKSASRPSTSSGPGPIVHQQLSAAMGSVSTPTANYNLSSLSHPIYQYPSSASASQRQFATTASYPLGVPIPYATHPLAFTPQPPTALLDVGPKTTEEELKLIRHRLNYLENIVLGGGTRPSTATSITPSQLLPPILTSNAPTLQPPNPTINTTANAIVTTLGKSRLGRSESSASASSSSSHSEHLLPQNSKATTDQTPPSSSGTQDGSRPNWGRDADGKSTSLGLKKKDDRQTPGTLDLLELMSGMDRERDISEALSCLPPRFICDELVDNYLQKLEWISKPLHVPSFKAQYTQFFAQITTNSSAEVDPAWLSLLLMILCLATKFFGAPSSTGSKQDVKPCAQPNPKLLFKMAYRLLSCSGALTAGTVESLQAIVLMSTWLEDQGILEMRRVLISTALRALQLRKLHPSAPFLQAELIRRLHWTLMSEDYQDSFDTGTYSIPPQQNRYSVPANLDDEDLGDRVLNPKSSDKATVMSYHLSKISFAQVIRGATDLQTVGESGERELSYENVIEVTKELRDAYERIPTFLRPDVSIADPSPSLRYLTWSRIMIGFLFHSTMLSLHFPSIIAGFCTPSKRRSVEISIFSAKTVILLMRHCEEIGFPVLSWGRVEKWIWKAGVTLCLDLFHIPVSGIGGEDERIKRDVADRREMITIAIEFLRRHNACAERLTELLRKDEVARYSATSPSRPTTATPVTSNGRKRSAEEMGQSEYGPPDKKRVVEGIGIGFSYSVPPPPSTSTVPIGSNTSSGEYWNRLFEMVFV